MSVMVLLISAGGAVALVFLAAFIWAVRSGQFDDTGTPPVRVLVDERDALRPSCGPRGTSYEHPAGESRCRSGRESGTLDTFAYDNRTTMMFAVATAVWGLVAFLVGLIVALKLIFPELLGGIAELSYGRLRPLHTNAAVFAFVGNGIFIGVYYSLQRLCKARMFSDVLSWIHFWGWQLIIVSAAITLPLGFTTSKEYAELEWPIDIAIALVWVVFGVNLIGTILKRRERHMYVAIWFYIATFVTVALLHIVNSLGLPVSLLKSYSMYAGVQDALVQWWYGHNAVAFFLTTPYLGRDVLLHAQGGQPAGVLLPAVDHPLLVA